MIRDKRHQVIHIHRRHVLPIARYLRGNHFGARGARLERAQRPLNKAVGVRCLLIGGADKIERRGQLVSQHRIERVTVTRVLIPERKRDRIARISDRGTRGLLHYQIGGFAHGGYRRRRLLRRLGRGHKRLIGQRVAHLHAGGVHRESNRVGFARIKIGQLPDERRATISGRRGGGISGLKGRVIGQAVGDRDTGQRYLAGVFIGDLVAQHLTHHNLRLRIGAGLGQADRRLRGVVRYSAHL